MRYCIDTARLPSDIALVVALKVYRSHLASSKVFQIIASGIFFSKASYLGTDL